MDRPTIRAHHWHRKVREELLFPDDVAQRLPVGDAAVEATRVVSDPKPEQLREARVGVMHYPVDRETNTDRTCVEHGLQGPALLGDGALGLLPLGNVQQEAHQTLGLVVLHRQKRDKKVAHLPACSQQLQFEVTRAAPSLDPAQQRCPVLGRPVNPCGCIALLQAETLGELRVGVFKDIVAREGNGHRTGIQHSLQGSALATDLFFEGTTVSDIMAQPQQTEQAAVTCKKRRQLRVEFA